MTRFLSLLVIFLVHFNFAYAANITDKDCAIGGVVAGWHSSHHYLPEKFNKTALRDAEWKTSKQRFYLDNYPKEYVLGFQNMPVERVSKDYSIGLNGVLTEQSRKAGDLFQALFKKDPIYIVRIAICESGQEDRSYELLASSMKTPRGIHLGSSERDVRALYGTPDTIQEGKNGNISMWYSTPETLMKKKNNKNYLGVGMMFLVKGGRVVAISVHNTLGY